MENKNITLEEINQKLEQKLLDKRKDLKGQLVKIIKKLNSIDLERENHIKVHMEMLILREDLVFESASYRSKLASIKTIYRNKRRDTYRKYSKNFEIELNSYYDKDTFISADLTQLIRQIDIMENYIYYLKEQILTCDKLGFSLKHIMESSQ